MKRFILFFVAIAAYGQTTATLAPNCPNNTQRPGMDATCSLVLTNGATPATALQWQTAVTGISGVSILQSVAGTAGTAGKSVTCNPANFCTLWSNDQATIANGQVATIRLTIPASGTLNVSVTGPLGSTAIGDKITIAASPLVTVSVRDKCDINGDGQTTVADVTAYNTAILSGTAPDLDGDGVGTVADLQRVVNAAGGQACR